ncbi:MAG: Smr/MutS family protein, partial [Bacteroidales bacterium]|nr:Smr/MutS family protein [Bacteroidales bacterium]
EASAILDNSNKLIEKTIREIKEHQNDKTAIKEIRQKLNAEKENLKTSLKEDEKQTVPQNTNTTYKPHLHDIVIIKDSQVAGEITAINGENVVVTFNSVNFRTNIYNIEKTDKKVSSKNTSKTAVFKEIQEKAVNFELQLDLRGLRAEEAISELTYYLDDAILLNIKEFSILHGKGNGILRQVVRDFLANNRYVSHFQDAHPDSGGFGVTIVKLI